MFVIIIGVIIIVLIVTVIHDLIVHDWLISSVRVKPPLSDITVVPNRPILQQIDVSFFAKDSRWALKFGKLQPAAYFIVLRLDPSPQPINRCDPSTNQYCPMRTGGIDHEGHYSEHFVIRWDAMGIHSFNIDVSVDGTQLGFLTAGVILHS